MVIYKFHYSVFSQTSPKEEKVKTEENSGTMAKACWAIMTREFDLPVSLVQLTVS